MRNGIILYLDQREPLRALPEASVGRLILAALDYAATGEEPAFTGEERLAWLFLRQAVDRDGERYEQRCEKARRAARTRWSAMQTHADDANSNDNPNSNSNSNSNSNPNSNDNSNSNSNCVCERARDARVPPTQAASRDTHAEKERKKPTLQDVERYVRERQSPVDPQAFLDFYEARSWTAGKSRITDWRAAVRAAERWECWKRKPRREDEVSDFARREIARMMSRPLCELPPP